MSKQNCRHKNAYPLVWVNNDEGQLWCPDCGGTIPFGTDMDDRGDLCYYTIGDWLLPLGVAAVEKQRGFPIERVRRTRGRRDK